jgi:hypothetical protein
MRLKSSLLIASLLMAPAALFSGSAEAAVPSLQVNPLEYQSTITGTDVRNGYVDVSNPTDTTINIQASVQGFRQDDLAGDLAFFQDSQVQQGIVLGLNQFTLGPRDAIRVTFSVDPTRLPKGGVYAAIFFRTVPPNQSSSSSFITESANIGTLLLLQNGPGKAVGSITKLTLPFWQFGAGLTGQGRYMNTNNTAVPIAFSPKLTSHIWPWGKGAQFTGPLVLPGSTRQFSLTRSGSYFGLLPVSLTDQTTGQVVTSWVFACTGGYALGILFLVLFLGVIFAYRLFRGRPLLPKDLLSPAQKFWSKLTNRHKKPKPPVRRQMDSIVRKAVPTVKKVQIPLESDNKSDEGPEPNSAAE